LRIEEYFRQVQKIIDSCSVIQSSKTMFDKRSTYEGFIRGDFYLLDGSILHLREFVDVESIEDRLMYVYQYISSSKELIFRYDNTGHHRKLCLPTYPHHKHQGSEDNVAPATAPDLASVLEEISSLVQLP